MRDEAMTERQRDTENGMRRSNKCILFVTHYIVTCIGMLVNTTETKVS